MQAHGDPAQAHKILTGALRRTGDSAEPADLVRTLAYHAELSVRIEERALASAALDRLETVVATLDADAHAEVAGTLAEAAELRTVL